MRSQNCEKRLLASAGLCPFVSPSVCFFVRPSVVASLSVCPSVCPSVCLSACPSFRPHATTQLPPFMKFDIWIFFENLSRKFKFHWYLTIITGILHENLCTFMIIFRSVLLGMEMFQTKVVHKGKLQILCSNISLSCAVYEVVWKNTVEPDRAQTIYV